MARKRTGLKKLDYQSPEYWERLLRQDGLSMERGTSRRLTYVGSASVLESIEADVVTKSEGSGWRKEITNPAANSDE